MAKVPDSSFPEKEVKEKKPRRVTVKNAKFYLYKIVDNGNLSSIASSDTELDIIIAYEHALDKGIPEERLVGYKGRLLDFAVKHTKRLIRVR